MNTTDELVVITDAFFHRHWIEPEPSPEWKFEWDFCGAVPNYLLGGLYALLAGNTVIYIGLGNSRGGGIYQERGISRRLGAHVLSLAPEGCEKSYVLQPRWQAAGVTDIGTIGFPAGLSYLAPALEDFLIGELNPPENSTRRRRS